MYDTLELAELNTVDVSGLMDATRNLTVQDALRLATQCHEIKQTKGWGDGQETACALSASMLVAKRRGYFA